VAAPPVVVFDDPIALLLLGQPNPESKSYFRVELLFDVM
jgi:hypothetical protein